MHFDNECGGNFENRVWKVGGGHLVVTTSARVVTAVSISARGAVVTTTTSHGDLVVASSTLLGSLLVVSTSTAGGGGGVDWGVVTSSSGRHADCWSVAWVAWVLVDGGESSIRSPRRRNDS